MLLWATLQHCIEADRRGHARSTNSVSGSFDHNDLILGWRGSQSLPISSYIVNMISVVSCPWVLIHHILLIWRGSSRAHGNCVLYLINSVLGSRCGVHSSISVIIIINNIIADSSCISTTSKHTGCAHTHRGCVALYHPRSNSRVNRLMLRCKIWMYSHWLLSLVWHEAEWIGTCPSLGWSRHWSMGTISRVSMQSWIIAMIVEPSCRCHSGRC